MPVPVMATRACPCAPGQCHGGGVCRRDTARAARDRAAQPSVAVPYVLLHRFRDALEGECDWPSEQELIAALTDLLKGEPRPEDCPV